MTDNVNGAPAPINPLAEAINRHSQLLLKLNRLPNGMIAIDASRLFCDIELLTVRVDVMFDALVEAGLLDAGEMVDSLRKRLTLESNEMQRLLDTPQLAIIRDIGKRN